mmetsp:Transcript_13469/g.17640  ORF Transcript_13469/g.17640 Transcript_13469/m.17640 type:complete len:485 (-) Transcript_13469:273-1727(-)
MAFVDDFISSTNLTVCLLCELRDVIRTSCLQILSMNCSGRIAKHLLVDCEINRVPNSDLASLRPLLQGGNVIKDCFHLVLANSTFIYGLAKRRGGFEVVISVTGIGIFEFLCKFNGRHGAFIGKLDSFLHDCKNFFTSLFQLFHGENAIFRICLFKDSNRILVIPCPLLLILAASLVFRISRRMTIESVSMHLEDGWSILSDIINNSGPTLNNISNIASIYKHSRYSIMRSNLINVAIRCDIGSVGINSATIINHNHEKREFILGSSIEYFRHTTVLASTFANKYNRDTIIIFTWGNIYLGLQIFRVIAQAQLTIKQNTLGCTSSIRKLFTHEGPSSLKKSILVKNMHTTSSTTASTIILHEQFSHDRSRGNPARQCMSMFSVIRIFHVSVLNGMCNQGRHTLLSIVQMHKSTNFTLHVLLITRILEGTCELHVTINFQQFLLVSINLGSVFGHLLRRISKAGGKLVCNVIPAKVLKRWTHGFP